ncbi:hypothetical protein pb186bvf_011170 [Paramecium bursaria]
MSKAYLWVKNFTWPEMVNIISFGTKYPEQLTQMQKATRLYRGVLRRLPTLTIDHYRGDNVKYYDDVHKASKEFRQLEQLIKNYSQLQPADANQIDIISNKWVQWLETNYDAFLYVDECRPYSSTSTRYFTYDDEDLSFDPFGFYKPKLLNDEQPGIHTPYFADYPLNQTTYDIDPYLDLDITDQQTEPNIYLQDIDLPINISNLFHLTLAPIYNIDTSDPNLSIILYREFNLGHPIILDDNRCIVEVVKTFDNYVMVKLDDQFSEIIEMSEKLKNEIGILDSTNWLSIQNIKQQYQKLTYVRVEPNVEPEIIALKERRAAILNCKVGPCQGTLFNYKGTQTLYIIRRDHYVYHKVSTDETMTFEFNFEYLEDYMMVVEQKCKICFYNNYSVQPHIVKVQEFQKYFIYTLFQTDYCDYKLINVKNILRQQDFFNAYFSSDVNMWKSEGPFYNSDYNTFKYYNDKVQIEYEVHDIQVSVGTLGRLNYIYIQNYSLQGEVLYGQISTADQTQNIEVAPSFYFVLVHKQPLKIYNIYTKICRYQKKQQQFLLEIQELQQKEEVDKNYIYDLIQNKGKKQGNTNILAKSNDLYILFSGKIMIKNIKNLKLLLELGRSCQRKLNIPN